jgi:hypothetical protein
MDFSLWPQEIRNQKWNVGILEEWNVGLINEFQYR